MDPEGTAADDAASNTPTPAQGTVPVESRLETLRQ